MQQLLVSFVENRGANQAIRVMGEVFGAKANFIDDQNLGFRIS